MKSFIDLLDEANAKIKTITVEELKKIMNPTLLELGLVSLHLF